MTARRIVKGALIGMLFVSIGFEWWGFLRWLAHATPH